MAEWLIQGHSETDEDELEHANENGPTVPNDVNPYHAIASLQCFTGVKNKVKRCLMSGCKTRTSHYCALCSGNDLGDANDHDDLKAINREKVVAVCREHRHAHTLNKHT
jgi:hypothetical protein